MLLCFPDIPTDIRILRQQMFAAEVVVLRGLSIQRRRREDVKEGRGCDGAGRGGEKKEWRKEKQKEKEDAEK